MSEDKANILVMGNSGAGKSTLINAVLGEDKAEASFGEHGTKEMNIYESDNVPFRLIDTMGMEYGLVAQMKARHQIEKWTKDNLSKGNKARCINMIWFCVDASAARLTKENVEMIKSVTKYWKDVPVIVVITKSYSRMKRPEYENIVRSQIERYGRGRVNVCHIISVVSKDLLIDEGSIVPQYGIDILVSKTAGEMPSALKMTEEAVYSYKVKMKKKAANAVTVTAASGAVAVGASPIPIADAAILVPVQTAMVQAIASIYGISNEDKKVAATIVECGTVSTIARGALSSLKAVIPVAGNVLNAVVAGVFTTAIGEISIYIMEEIYKGNRSADDLDWIKKISEAQFNEKINSALPFLKEWAAKGGSKKVNDIAKAVSEIFKKSSK